MRGDPAIALFNRAVMHVVVEIGNDEGHGWQLVEIRREARQRLLDALRSQQRLPGIVFARRTGLDIADETLARGDQGAGERRHVVAVLAVVANSLGRAAEQREIIRLARMGNGEGVGEVRALRREVAQEPGLAAAHDLIERMIFHHHNDHMIGGRQVGRAIGKRWQGRQ